MCVRLIATTLLTSARSLFGDFVDVCRAKQKGSANVAKTFHEPDQKLERGRTVVEF